MALLRAATSACPSCLLIINAVIIDITAVITINPTAISTIAIAITPIIFIITVLTRIAIIQITTRKQLHDQHKLQPALTIQST